MRTVCEAHYVLSVNNTDTASLDVEMSLLDKLMSWTHAREAIRIEQNDNNLYEPTEEDYKIYFRGIDDQVTQVTAWIQILKYYNTINKVSKVSVILKLMPTSSFKVARSATIGCNIAPW